MKVIVAKAYGRFSVGHIIPDMPANQARSLIARGMVKEAEAEGRALRSPADRMMRKRVVK